MRHHAHHFASAEAEFEASKQGMWVFLVTEVLMFGGLLVGYGIFRNLYPEAFHEAHKHLAVSLGAINTVFLISSSVTMALAVTYTQMGKRVAASCSLIGTLTLAFSFLCVKYVEYSHKFHDGLLPAGYFTNTELKLPEAPLFFSLYFMTTGLHMLHVLIGMGLLIWILRRTWSGELSSGYCTPTELVGFYWHFVDLVWIFLFPLLYLVG